MTHVPPLHPATPLGGLPQLFEHDPQVDVEEEEDAQFPLQKSWPALQPPTTQVPEGQDG